MLRQDLALQSSLTWTNTATGEKLSSCGCEVDTRDMAAPWMRLFYQITSSGEQIDYRVRLTTTPLPWGGVRWWFICPLVANGRSCERRCGKLYLPSGGRYYGCRRCYDLTYTSCQESHQFDRLYRMIAAKTGTHPALVKKALKT
jgi:hypothetical protein